ncbi:fructose-6-P aldolase [Haematococcus lacustris]
MQLGRQAAPYNRCPRCNVIRRAILREAPSQSVRTQLRLFVDSASTTQLQLWLSTGLFHGFTCNPVILQRDGVKCNLSSISGLAKAGFDMGAKEIHLQAWGSNVTSMSSIAFDLSGIDPEKVVVKLPCTLEGVQTAGLLRDSNVRVTLTGLYAAPQVLLAQAVGAEYAAPYLGRMNDAYGGEQGFQQVLEMQRALHGCKSQCRLLVASLRDPADMTRLAAEGCDTFTFSPSLAARLFNNAYSIDAAAEFAAAAQENSGEEDLKNGQLAGLTGLATKR